MERFAEIVKYENAVNYLPHLDIVWQGFGYASEVASNDVSFLNQFEYQR